MKKIFMIITSCIFVFLLVGCNVSVGVKSRKGDLVDFKQKSKINDIDEIIINTGESDVVLKNYDKNKIKIVGKKLKNDEKIKIAVKGKKLEIEDPNKSSSSIEKPCFNFGMYNNTASYTIYIPSSFNGKIDFKNGTGDINITDLVVDKFYLEAGVGDVEIKDVKIKDFNCNVGVGDFDFELSDCGNVIINGGVGNCDVVFKDVNGNFEFNSGVGDCNVSVPEDSDIKIVENGNGVGNINNNAKLSGDGKYIFKFTSGVGNINIDNN